MPSAFDREAKKWLSPDELVCACAEALREPLSVADFVEKLERRVKVHDVNRTTLVEAVRRARTVEGASPVFTGAAPICSAVRASVEAAAKRLPTDRYAWSWFKSAVLKAELKEGNSGQAAALLGPDGNEGGVRTTYGSLRRLDLAAMDRRDAAVDAEKRETLRQDSVKDQRRWFPRTASRKAAEQAAQSKDASPAVQRSMTLRNDDAREAVHGSRAGKQSVFDMDREALEADGWELADF
ncbi:unnamed protein product [Pedinophyceae sp. YPF-701]|nr:unnamed protein product [Pedinophyceae sp. YPF-701]